MIKNGRPYTSEDGGLDKMLIKFGVQPKPDEPVNPNELNWYYKVNVDEAGKIK